MVNPHQSYNDDDVVRDMILRAGLGIYYGYSERASMKDPDVPRVMVTTNRYHPKEQLRMTR